MPRLAYFVLILTLLGVFLFVGATNKKPGDQDANRSSASSSLGEQATTRI